MASSSMRPASTERGLVEPGAHQQHGVVAREEGAVVAQHAQLQSGDLRVGGVRVDHVDLRAARAW
jgi:hypothetical protein